MSAKVARVVATASFTNQSSALGTTTLFTPTADGQYRVNIYISKRSGAGFIIGTLGWTDDAGAQTNADQIQAPGPGCYTRYLKAKANDAITIATSYSGGTPTYDLYTCVEELE